MEVLRTIIAYHPPRPLHIFPIIGSTTGRKGWGESGKGAEIQRKDRPLFNGVPRIYGQGEARVRRQKLNVHWRCVFSFEKFRTK